MRYIPGSIAAVVIPILLFSGACSIPIGSPTPEQVQQDTPRYVLDGLVSACDHRGNLVYVREGNKTKTLAVVPNDPSCKEAS